MSNWFTTTTRALATVFIACIALSGCEGTTPTQPSALGNDRQIQRAERLSREGKSSEAAAAYEELAAQSTADLRSRLLLRAAREHVRAGDEARATTLLKQAGTSLPTADMTLRSLVAAELALNANRPDAALAELNRIPQPIARDWLPDILELR